LQAEPAGQPPVSFLLPTNYNIDTFLTPEVDRDSLLQQDLKDGLALPFCFGYPFDVALSLANSGTWEDLPDGGRLWRLRIVCPGAFSVNLLFDSFYIPPGGRLWIYDDEGFSVLGPFTEENNKPSGKFATGLTRGQACTLEYYEPGGRKGQGRIRISRIVYGYRDVFSGPEKETLWKAFGDAGFCEVNVACEEGETWRAQARAVGMVLVSGGTALCTGVLLNNVREDWTPYFLTANHCLDHGGVEFWVVAFNYESPSCESKRVSMEQTISGASVTAADPVSDFALLKLSRRPPVSYGVYYAGWSALDTAPLRSVCIHHPRGDVKKISIDNDPAVSAVYPWNPWEVESHWKVEHWDTGSTEPGSSGAPLFDQNHRVVGQLTGGTASCTVDGADYFGKLALAWEGQGSPETRLKDWLDPDGTGTRVLDGAFAPNEPPVVTIVYPPAEAVVTGVVSVEAQAQDDVGISRVDFYVNDELVQSSTFQPYRYRWDVHAVPDGVYRLEVVALDVTGLSAQASITVYRRRAPVATGDSNCDGELNVGDAICILGYLFGPASDPCKDPCCLANFDTNDDDKVDLGDAIGLLSYLFSGVPLQGPDGSPVGTASCRRYEESDVLLPCRNPCE